MNKIFTKNKTEKGYAILFTVVIVSAISVITAGLTNAAYKQLILSSLAKDSQLAFYQADTAADCGLYADIKNPSGIITTGGAWSCGSQSLTVSAPDVNGSYTILPINDTVQTPCFRIIVNKTIVPSLPDDIIQTKISAKGYNTCNVSNPRTVEREIEINYEE